MLSHMKKQTEKGSQNLAPLKVLLVVVHDPALKVLLAGALAQKTTYLPIFVESSVEALEVTSEFIPDLFLLDDELPFLNGMKLYHQLQTMELMKHVPAIIMSERLVQENTAFRQQSLKIVNKPIEPNILAASIIAWFE